MAGLRYHNRIGGIGAAAVALLLATIAVGICVLESGFEPSGWLIASAVVGVAGAAGLPLLGVERPRLALVLSVILGSVVVGMIPIAAIIARRVVKRSDPVVLVTVPLGAAMVMAGGLATRVAFGLAPGADVAVFATVVSILTLIAGAKVADLMRVPSAGVADRMRVSEVDREWLSRRIHDGVGHHLALLGLRARIRSSAPEPASGEWRAVVDDIERAFDDLYRLLHELDDAPVDDPRAALDAYVARARAAGAVIRVEGRRHLDGVDDTIAELAVRTCTEGLANAAKYADPGVIRVRFTADSERFEAAVISPCAGCRPGRPGSGRGLEGLRERIELAGGEVRAGAERGAYVLASRFGPEPPPAAPRARRSFEPTAVPG